MEELTICLPADVAALLAMLRDAGFPAYTVGGCVRDALLGITPHDWDICTSALPEQMQQVFKDLHTVETGLKHGTLTVVVNHVPYEITTFRVDGEYTDHRHPDSVSFVDNIAEDLSRRDFTVNAMAWSPDSGLVDLFDGREDLAAGVIRCVGDPALRFDEDALRVLRALRFASVYDFSIDPATDAAARKLAPSLHGVAGERIREELMKLLCGKGVGRILRAYPDVLSEIIPEIRPMVGYNQQNHHHSYDLWEHTVRAVENVPAEADFRLAMLLHDTGKPRVRTTDEHGEGHYRGHQAVSAEIAERAAAKCPSVQTLIMVNGSREGWHDFNAEYPLFTRRYHRPEGASCGDDLALMFFTSGTTGNPKMAAHKHTYALGHYVTAKYWHCCERDGLHFTISDTGWGKSLWGKLYGQWLCEGAVFVYDFDKFDAADILPMFKKYNITTFCAPPTMLRLFIKVDLANYDLSSVHHMTTAGEALNPEVFRQFEKATGLKIMEGFGQTETTLTIGNLYGGVPRIGSMGKANPQYDVDLVDPEGNPVPNGEVGEIVIRTKDSAPCGLFREYYLDEEKTTDAWHDGLYHTGDTAWRDEDGYFWYVSRIDDVIKSSGYRIGPFEIESVIMELPYVLECGVSAAPDEIRGQVVKASIVLTKGTEPTEELKKVIQDYVKQHTAPYKYPRIVVFRDELPKTVSGKIQRALL